LTLDKTEESTKLEQVIFPGKKLEFQGIICGIKEVMKSLFIIVYVANLHPQ
jgi:hypothetical protein